MRKSIDALAAIVQQRFHLDPFGENMFVFCSRGRDRIKILKWDRNGFWLYYKRLEKGKLSWPCKGGEKREIEARELRWLLDGLSVQQPQAHSVISLKNAV